MRQRQQYPLNFGYQLLAIGHFINSSLDLVERVRYNLFTPARGFWLFACCFGRLLGKGLFLCNAEAARGRRFGERRRKLRQGLFECRCVDSRALYGLPRDSVLSRSELRRIAHLRL